MTTCLYAALPFCSLSRAKGPRNADLGALPSRRPSFIPISCQLEQKRGWNHTASSFAADAGINEAEWQGPPIEAPQGLLYE